jgi:hypothetical protein
MPAAKVDYWGCEFLWLPSSYSDVVTMVPWSGTRPLSHLFFSVQRTQSSCTIRLYVTSEFDVFCIVCLYFIEWSRELRLYNINADKPMTIWPGRKRSLCNLRYRLCIYIEGLKKTTRNMRIIGVPSEIRTGSVAAWGNILGPWSSGEVVPVLNSLNTTPWRRMGEWMYISTYSWPRN